MNDNSGQNEAKVFSEKAISWGTFLGGPLATGYLMSRNFNLFGEEERSRKALYLGLLATAVLFGVLAILPENIVEKIPKQILPLIYTAVAYGLVTEFQEEKIVNFLEQGGVKASGWKTAGIGVVCLIVSIVYFISIALLMPNMTGSRIIFGEQQHEIFYGEGVSEDDAHKLREALSRIGIDELDFSIYCKLEKDVSGYRLLFPVSKDFWNDAETVEFYKAFSRELETNYLGAPVQMVFFEEGFNGREEQVLQE